MVKIKNNKKKNEKVSYGEEREGSGRVGFCMGEISGAPVPPWEENKLSEYC